ncbi:MAG: hypothetical protein V4692_15455 [Bdellovibrionota bacterium]
MKHVFVLLAFIGVFTCGEAKAEPSQFTINAKYGQLLSFQKVMSLTPARRQAYLNSVREIVHEFEKMQKEKSVSVADLQEAGKLRIYVRLFDALVENVEAAGNQMPMRASVRSGKERAILCKAPYVAQRLTAKRSDNDLRNFICVLQSQKVSTTIPGTNLPQLYRRCPGETVSVNQRSDGSYLCATRDSFLAAHEDSQIVFQTPHPKYKDPDQVLADARRAAQLKRLEAAKKKSAEAAAVEARLPAVSLDAAEDELKCDATSGRVLLPRPDGSQFCNDDTIRAAREKYYVEKGNQCIYAGTITKYLDGEPGPGRCASSDRFCLGDKPDCRDEASGEKAPAIYKCAQSNQQICNPLVYGVKPNGANDKSDSYLDNEPFCVTKGARATEACGELADQGNAVFSIAFGKEPGVMESWNQFVKDFASVCEENDTAKRFLCRECHSMRQRLVKANMDALDIKDCGKLQPFTEQQMASRTAGPAKRDPIEDAGTTPSSTVPAAAGAGAIDGK